MIHELNTKEIETILSQNYHGHLACSMDNQPYVVPVSYVWKDKKIFSYTHEGKKVSMLRQNPRVCLQVEQISKTSWKSVLVMGSFRELHGQERADAVAIIANFVNDTEITPGFLREDMVTMGSTDDTKKPVIYCIDSDSMTGRVFGELTEEW